MIGESQALSAGPATATKPVPTSSFDDDPFAPPAKKALSLEAQLENASIDELETRIEKLRAEIAQCETDWQGAYVLARGAGVALTTILGEPPTGHRGWEPAYLDLYGFMKVTKHAVGTPAEFLDESMGKRPWPK